MSKTLSGAEHQVLGSGSDEIASGEPVNFSVYGG